MTQSVGGSSAKWSLPAGYESSGYVWWGEKTCTEEDIKELKDARGDHVGIDEASLCGRWHPEWTSAWESTKPPENRNGGLGSPYFETQYCGEGVRFTKEPIWHFRKRTEDDPDGDRLIYVMEVPPNCGAYHRIYDGDGFLNMHGPEYGSEAQALLDRRAYHWSEALGVYYPGPDEPTPWW